MTEWFSDGRPCDAIPVDDRAVQYGDGLFETVAVRDGRPRLWNYHVERLQSSAVRLGIEAPDDTRLRSGVCSALDQAQADQSRCVAKIVLTAGSGPRGYRRDGQYRLRGVLGRKVQPALLPKSALLAALNVAPPTA